MLVQGTSTLSVGKINFGGSIIAREDYNNNITMVTNSVIVPLILHESLLNESLDLFISNIEKLKAKIVHKNVILENIGNTSKKQRCNIFIFKEL